MHRILELKPGWCVRVPVGFTHMDMARCRFDPVTMIAVTALAGTGVQAFGMYQQGQAAKAQGKAEQDIANYNAQVAEQQAEEERRAAAFQAQKHEREGEALQARQKALYAKGGVSLQGSPLSVLADSAYELEMDRLMILRDGRIKEGQMRSRAATSRMQGSAAAQRGRNQYYGSMLSAGGTILSGTSNAYYNNKMLKMHG